MFTDLMSVNLMNTCLTKALNNLNMQDKNWHILMKIFRCNFKFIIVFYISRFTKSCILTCILSYPRETVAVIFVWIKDSGFIKCYRYHSNRKLRWRGSAFMFCSALLSTSFQLLIIV